MRGWTRCRVLGRTAVTCVLAASAFWLSACGRVRDPEKSSSPGTNADVRQITLHVPGMIDRQGIT